MADRTVNGLHGCLSSMDMTLGPCTELASDSLAREQFALLKKYLGFVSQRIPLIGDRVRYELGWYVEMGAGVHAAAPAAASDTLGPLIERGKALLATPSARQVEREATTSGLRSEISRIVRASRTFDPATRREIDAVVVRCSRPLIAFERAWFAPQGWESNAEPLPDIEALLAERP